MKQRAPLTEDFAGTCPAELAGKPYVLHLQEQLSAALNRVTALETLTLHLEEEAERQRTTIRKQADLIDKDALTGLYNGKYFNRALDQSVGKAPDLLPDTILMIDLNGFKKINDTYGHEVGNVALKLVADNLKENVRHSDVVARLGGDEFAILLRGFDKEDAHAKYAQINTMFSNLHFIHEGQRINVHGSVGFWKVDPALSAHDNKTGADFEMYRQKDAEKRLRNLNRSVTLG